VGARGQVDKAVVCGTKVQWPQLLFFGIVKFTISTNVRCNNHEDETHQLHARLVAELFGLNACGEFLYRIVFRNTRHHNSLHRFFENGKLALTTH